MMEKKPQENKASLSKIFLLFGLPGLAHRSHRNVPAKEQGQESSNRFLLQVVQPGLAGLMDASVSTLAPIFAAAFATHRPLTAFLVGMAAATGAGISMAFSEALSDDGVLTGRGNPILRGLIPGLWTFFEVAWLTMHFSIIVF